MNGMAQPIPRTRQAEFQAAIHILAERDWTGADALAIMPETTGPRVEIFRGGVIVTPHAGWDHQVIRRELAYVLHRAARRAGFWAVPELNVLSGDDLFIPDIVVVRSNGAGKAAVDIADTVLLVEIASQRNRRKDVIHRPSEYAVAGVPWYMRVDFLNRVPAVVLSELVKGKYKPVANGAAGSRFVMKEPFAFEVDPADLLDD